MYCAPDDVRRALVADDADAADVAQTAASMDNDQLSDHIADAQSEVDSKLAVRYDVPLADGDVPPVVKQITTNIAAYLATLTFYRTLDLGAQDPVALRYNRAESLLGDIRDGKAQLPIAPPADPPQATGGMKAVQRPAGPLFPPDDFGLGYGPARDWGDW